MASIWVTATDSDNGLILSRHDSEKEAYDSVGDELLPKAEYEKFKAILDEDVEEAHDYMNKYLSNCSIDSYTVEEFKIGDPEPPKREPMPCPFCKEGELRVRTDAYTYRDLYEIKVEEREATTGSKYLWTEPIADQTDQPEVNEFDDYHITCSDCEFEGSEDEVVAKLNAAFA